MSADRKSPRKLLEKRRKTKKGYPLQQPYIFSPEKRRKNNCCF
jgi:hypothetical protein